MSEHRASLTWKQGDKGFELKTFCRNHTVRFASGAEVPASSAPDWGGDPAAWIRKPCSSRRSKAVTC
jgi:hypothetical protein